MFRNLQTKLKYDHGLILQRVCIRVQGSPDDFRKDRGYAARHIAPEAEIHNGAVPGPAPARIGHPVRSQQRVYFVDGYHGGIYGHYPVAWKTRFITDQLAAHPEWRIGLEIEPETWDTVEVRTPADYARFKAIAADRRVEFTNPSYAQPYCYNISGESIIRQFGYGMRKIRSHFPDVEFVTYSVEEPCFTSCLPQILKLYGFKYAS